MPQLHPGDTYTLSLAATPGRGPILLTVTEVWPSQYLEGCVRCEALGEFRQQWFFGDSSEASATVTVVSAVAPGSELAAVRCLADAVDRVLVALAEHVTGSIHPC